MVLRKLKPSWTVGLSVEFDIWIAVSGNGIHRIVGKKKRMLGTAEEGEEARQ